jgi:MYXO-CTERM domain-containing protein
MARLLRPFSLGFVLVSLIAGTAAADPISSRLAPGEGKRVTVEVAAQTAPLGMISPNLYLNRCTGGCVIHGGATSDARTQQSSIPGPGDYTITEFASEAGMTGAAADADWAKVVQCMKEVYSPFAVTVSDTKPAGGASYTEAIIAGNPSEIQLNGGILGIAPLAGDCSPQDNVISFSFANHHGGTGQPRIWDICWTAAQESAHAFGLDHEVQFSDGTSACNDPMTYNIVKPCGGERFFRNKPASCGEDTIRQCRCGGSQNSHSKILAVFGAGQSIVPAPTSSIILPADQATVTKGFTVQVSSGSARGVAKVELWLNGYNWATQQGAAYGGAGQPNPSTYALTAPANVPDGVIDVVAKAYDDLNIETDSTMITVTKGAPCATAASCLDGQKCEAGKCFWDPPAGVLGNDCTYPQFCISGQCDGPDGAKICTQDCVVSATDSCPPGYDCISTSQTGGICYTQGQSSGCCSVDHESSHAIWVHAGLGALVIGLVLRRRRRR